MKRFSLYLLLAVSIAAIGLVSCKKDEDQPLPPVTPVIITAIEIVDAPDTLEVGTTQKINLKFTPTEPTRKKVNWSSSDSTVATVDEDGVVSPLKMGDVTIAVKADTGNASASCKIKVVAPVITDAMVKEKLELLYASLCQVYGEPYYYASLEIGTDEATYGAKAEQKYKNHDFTAGDTLKGAGSGADVLWETAFPVLNSANYVINFAGKNVTKSLVAEARFFRAFWYFQLVQTFGGVPLDLGAGELNYNTGSVVPGKRLTVADVYAKCIFPDLEAAVSDTGLNETPREYGGVSKNAARLVLSKAYLTYAWWLENPNNIATYPMCDRDASQAKTYFQKAYDMAVAGINEPGSYALCNCYYFVNEARTKSNEVLLFANHGKYDSPSKNLAGSLMNWDYTLPTVNGVPMVMADFSQYLGYPMTYMAPTKEGVTKYTAVEIDSRWDASFTSMYYAKWDKSKYPVDRVIDKNFSFSYDSETPFLQFDFVSGNEFDYPGVLSDMNGAGINAGTVQGGGGDKYYFNVVSRRVFPALWKLGSDGTGSAGSGTTRPFPILKFSEFYLIAAEAAVKGASTKSELTTAYALINVLRGRAGKWCDKKSGIISVDHSAEMIAGTAKTITIDYVLDERSREYYGEGYRWLDLVRTQTWDKIAAKYIICGSALGDVTPIEYGRSIKTYHYLRPIPQSQIDLVPEAEKKDYQNPQYR